MDRNGPISPHLYSKWMEPIGTYWNLLALGLTAEDLFMTNDDIYIGSEAPAYPLPPNAVQE